MKSKGAIIGISLLGAIILIILWGVNVNNSIITLNESTSSAWAQVENQYQRRADLVPNLVESVKGYAKHERELLKQ